MHTVLAERALPTGQTLQLIQGDLTAQAVDAIVNAANEQLQHGGGVAWAIARKGGPTIQRESHDWVRQHGPVSHARPAWTSGGQLPAKYVIHAVGPVWINGREEEEHKLASAVSGSLQVAEELHCTSLALPAISTGIFGFPTDRAARIIFSTTERFFSENAGAGLRTIKFVLYDQPTVEVFVQGWRSLWGP